MNHKENVCHGIRALTIAVSGLSAILLFWAIVLLIVCTNTYGVKPQSDWLYSGKDYYFAGIGVILGAIATVALGSFEYQRRTAKQRHAAKSALLERLQFNDDRVVQMLGQFAKGETPNYPLDTVGIIIWLSLSREILEKGIIDAINWHRYQLDHINAKLVNYTLFIRMGAGQSTKTEQVKEDYMSLVEHLNLVHKDIHALMDQLRAFRRN